MKAQVRRRVVVKVWDFDMVKKPHSLSSLRTYIVSPLETSNIFCTYQGYPHLDFRYNFLFLSERKKEATQLSRNNVAINNPFRNITTETRQARQINDSSNNPSCCSRFSNFCKNASDLQKEKIGENSRSWILFRPPRSSPDQVFGGLNFGGKRRKGWFWWIWIGKRKSKESWLWFFG